MAEELNSWPAGEYTLNVGEWTDHKAKKRYKRGEKVTLDSETATRLGSVRVPIQTWLEPPRDNEPAKVSYSKEEGLIRPGERKARTVEPGKVPGPPEPAKRGPGRPRKEDTPKAEAIEPPEYMRSA